MHYEEKLIDGFWCVRYGPNEEFVQMNATKLNNKVIALTEQLAKKQGIIDRFGSFLDHWSLKYYRDPNDVYAAWDKARE